MFCCKLDKTYKDIPNKDTEDSTSYKICTRCGSDIDNASLCSICIDASIGYSNKQRLCIKCNINISYLPECYKVCRKCFPSPNFCITCRKPIMITKSYCSNCSKRSTAGSL